jgi:hypothetical protein
MDWNGFSYVNIEAVLPQQIKKGSAALNILHVDLKKSVSEVSKLETSGFPNIEDYLETCP